MLIVMLTLFFISLFSLAPLIIGLALGDDVWINVSLIVAIVSAAAYLALDMVY